MNRLLKSGKMIEKKINENFSYTFIKECSLNQLEYKVMQGQGKNGIIRCMSMLYNGNDYIIYMPDDMKNLKSISNRMTENDFILLVANLMKEIIDIKKNGFLSCQNIDIADDKIYVDTKTFNVKLVYVPANPKLYNDYDEFEDEFRAVLARIINAEFKENAGDVQQLYYKLCEDNKSIEDIYFYLEKNKMSMSSVEGTGYGDTNIKLVSINIPIPMEIVIDKQTTTIGRNSSMSDISINFTQTIGRRHCTIIRNGRQCMIKDENTVNGTYVNDMRVMPGQMMALNNGDIISLADIRFKVVVCN